ILFKQFPISLGYYLSTLCCACCLADVNPKIKMTEDEVDYFRNVAENNPTYCVDQICRRLEHSDQSGVLVLPWPYKQDLLIDKGMECIASGHPDGIIRCPQKNAPHNGYMGYVLVEDIAKEMLKAIKNSKMFCIIAHKIRTDLVYVDKSTNLLELQYFFQ
ncbi:hypothetical protein QYM36_017917, partial [Artemia franciscana]